jgi:hypothetical protein
VPVQIHPISAAKKEGVQEPPFAGFKKKRSRKPTNLPAKKKTEPQTRRLPPKKKIGGNKPAVGAVRIPLARNYPLTSGRFNDSQPDHNPFGAFLSSPIAQPALSAARSAPAGRAMGCRVAGNMAVAASRS